MKVNKKQKFTIMPEPASYYATKKEALALELADKTAQEEAAFKASFAPLARYITKISVHVLQ